MTDALPPSGGPLLRRLSSFTMLRPLAARDFALLWTGTAISMLGDGIYFVALAWQVLELSNAPTALSIVGVAWTVPHVVFLLPGGVLSDRFDRRRLLVAADVIRGVAIGTAGALSLAGTLEISHLLVLVAVYGVGDALFAPSFEAIVPDVVPRDDLVQANSLVSFLRPLAFRFAGPALGGLLVATVGAAAAFVADAATFVFSAGAILLMRRTAPPRNHDALSARSALREIGEGFAFVRSKRWLWGTLAAAALAMFAIQGSVRVLVPFLVRNELHAGAGGLGLVLAAGGIGGMLASLVVGPRPPPTRRITAMYLLWAGGGLLLAGFALVAELWQAMAVELVSSAGIAAGTIMWVSLFQALVPRSLLGRVSSLDWLVSISLTPLSFAVAGPIGEALGARRALLAAGLFAGATTLGFLLLPGVRDPERH